MPRPVPVLCLLLTACLPSSSFAQESYGFADPADLDALLEYRLPDWGYRTWDASFGLDGSGSSRYGTSGEYHAASSRWGLGSDLDWTRHGERREWRLAVGVEGNYAGGRTGSPTTAIAGHQLDGALRVTGAWDEYLGGGPVSLGVTAAGQGRYHENVQDRVTAAGSEDYAGYDKRREFAVGPVVGLGRLRDVTPVLRARRLSERLVALGRAPLRPDQERQVAEVLVREQGYRQVYERPDRRFWRDVLEPMLEPDRPLSPYEIFYLRDVLAEDLGTRRQGARLGLAAVYREDRHWSGASWDRIRQREAAASLAVARNLSLHHQVEAALEAAYRWGESIFSATDFGDLDLSLVHDWNVTDRWRVVSSGRASLRYLESERAGVEREFRARLGSEGRLRVEDAVYVVASVAGTYSHGRDGGSAQGDGSWYDGWSWTYGLGLQYVLDRLLY